LSRKTFIQTHISAFTGLPVQTRDYALGVKDDMAKSDVNREYFHQNAEREVLWHFKLARCFSLHILHDFLVLC